MQTLKQLKEERLRLLAALVQIDQDIRQIAGRDLIQQKFQCSCQQTFKTYLERQLHISTLDTPNHYPLGSHKEYFTCPHCKSKYISQADLDRHTCKKVQVPARLGRDLIDFNSIE